VITSTHKRWRFAEWFEAQFGRRPMGDGAYRDLLIQTKNTEREAARLRGILAEEQLLVYKWRAAALVWNIADAEKRSKVGKLSSSANDETTAEK
jgi:hypothetical protein